MLCDSAIESFLGEAKPGKYTVIYDVRRVNQSGVRGESECPCINSVARLRCVLSKRRPVWDNPTIISEMLSALGTVTCASLFVYFQIRLTLLV